MSGETRFAFYSTITGSTLPASSIGSGSIETYHLSASAVTPAKADLTQAWDFTGGLLVDGVTIGASGSSYTADEATLTLSGSTFSVKNGGIGTSHLSESAVTPAKADLTQTWNFVGALQSSGSVVATEAFVASGSTAAKGSVRTVVQIDTGPALFGVEFSYAAGVVTSSANTTINALSSINNWKVNDNIFLLNPADDSVLWSGAYKVTDLGGVNELNGTYDQGDFGWNLADGITLLFQCNTDNTYAADIYTDVTNWTPLFISVADAATVIATPSVAYDAGENYNVRSFIYEDGVIYISRADSNLNNTPTESPDWWTAVAIGDFGTTGAPIAFTRCSNFDSSSDIVPGSFWLITDDEYAGSPVYLTTEGPFVLDTTNLAFAIGPRVYIGDETTITLSQTVFSVLAGGIGSTELAPNAVTPAKADLTQAWDFTGGLLVDGVSVLSSGPTGPIQPKGTVKVVKTFESLATLGVSGTLYDKTAKTLTGVANQTFWTAVNEYGENNERFLMLFSGSSYSMSEPAWNSGSAYVRGDIVSNSGSVYSSYSSNTGEEPAISPSYWHRVTDAVFNGIYSLSNVGYGPSQWVMTRASNFTSSSQVQEGSYVLVAEPVSGNNFYVLGPNTTHASFIQSETGNCFQLDSEELLFTALPAPVPTSGSIGSSQLADGSVTAIKLKSDVVGGGMMLDGSNALQVYLTGSTLEFNAGGIRVATVGITATELAASVAGSGLGGAAGSPLSVNVDGTTIDITNDTLTFVSGGIQTLHLSESAVTPAKADLTTEWNFISGSVIVATPVSNSHATPKSYVLSAISESIGGVVVSVVTTSNTQTAEFNIGVVPADTIWSVKFTTFSVDTVDPVNQVSNIGAFTFYRSGSNNVTQVGSTEIEHSFVSGAFTSVSMSANLAGGQPGNVDFVLHGINLYNIKHWAKFQVTEFVYA